MLRVQIPKKFQMYHRQEDLKNLNTLFLSKFNRINIISKT